MFGGGGRVDGSDSSGDRREDCVEKGFFDYDLKLEQEEVDGFSGKEFFNIVDI